MSRPRERWWGFARRMIRDYPSLKYQWDDLHEQSITADLSGTPRGGGAGRTVENLSFRQLPDEDDQKVFDAVERAIEITGLKPNGAERISLIKKMYWNKKTMTLKSAALQIPVAEVTAKRWHGDFVRLVGQCYGFHSASTKR